MRRVISLALVLSFAAACSASDDLGLTLSSDPPVPTEASEVREDSGPDDTSAELSEPADSDPSDRADVSTIVVEPRSSGRQIDERLLGTNVPAWVGPDRLADPDFRALTAASGTTLLRLPGGSWSNSYDWLGCELGDTDTCYWPWAATPSDFAGFIASLDLPAMWTVSINGTAEEAAALVAFFNGDPDDDRPIGVDGRGRDWATVGSWAALRRDAGFAEPVRIEYWEVGNEIFAANPATGGEGCVSFGWEDVWTCDGAEYIEGDGVNDGFVEFRDAMDAVDPTIQVGAVGVPDGESWGRWGTEVLERVGADLDFYVIHHYAFGGAVDAGEVVDRAVGEWGRISEAVTANAAGVGLAGTPPVAVTEYNVAAVQEQDADAVMATQLGALYVALSIGEMAEAGVGIANHWNLANGRAPNGTDYGMIDAETGRRNPAYYAFVLWSRFGEEFVDVEVDLGRGSGLAGVHAGRRADGSTTILLINSADTPEEMVIEPGLAADVTADIVAAPSLSSGEVTFNGSANPSPGLDEAPVDLGSVEEQFRYEIPGASMVLLTLRPGPDQSTQP